MKRSGKLISLHYLTSPSWVPSLPLLPEKSTHFVYQENLQTFKNRFCHTIVPANADLQSGSYLFVRPSKMKAGSIFIVRELHGGGTKAKFTFHLHQAEPLTSQSGAGSHSRQNTVPGGAAASAGRMGVVRPQIQDGRGSQRPAQAQSTEKFSPSGVPAT